MVGDGEHRGAAEGELARPAACASRPRPGWSGRSGRGRRSGAARPSATTAVAVVAAPPGRSTNPTPRSGRNRNTERMLPPGWPPSVPSWGRSSAPRTPVRRPPRWRPSSLADRRDRTSTVPSSLGAAVVLDLLQRQDVRAPQVVTTCPARRSNFACGSSGARFSTLNVATARSCAPWAPVTSRCRPPGATSRGAGQLELVVAEGVVQRPRGVAGDRVAHVGRGHRPRRQQRVVELHPGGVGLVVAAVDDAAVRAAGGGHALSRDHRDLTERRGGAHRPRRRARRPACPPATRRSRSRRWPGRRSPGRTRR